MLTEGSPTAGNSLEISSDLLQIPHAVACSAGLGNDFGHTFVVGWYHVDSARVAGLMQLGLRVLCAVEVILHFSMVRLCA